MSINASTKQSGGYYKGILVGVILTITIITVFNQITGSVNLIPQLSDKQSFHIEQHSNNSVISKLHDLVITQKKPVDIVTTVAQPKETLPTQTQNVMQNQQLSIVKEKSKDVTESHPATLFKPIIHNANSTISKWELQDGNRLSRTQCAGKFGKRGFFSESEKRLPPMLYTFPGSGNTWCRLLIEYSTGIYTGAVYNDASLLEALPGEFTCNHLVSVVKVHPHTHGFEELRLGTFSSDNGKCKKGNVKGFKRAILLIRNPFDSIWSEFQRRVSQSHVTGINRKGFDWHRWQANAASLSHLYHEMWAQHHAGIERHFRPEDILYIKYEDLKSRADGANVATMRRVTDFLHVQASTEKLSCAFVLAENRDAHRSIDATKSMTKEDAYTKELACRMWALFGEFASKHGYKPINGYDCSDTNKSSGSISTTFPKIHRVNVGAQGEYDHKWVKPGGKLIDFGGYDKSLYAKDEQGSGSGGGAQNAHNHNNFKSNGGGGGSGLKRHNKQQKRQGAKRPASEFGHETLIQSQLPLPVKTMGIEQQIPNNVGELVGAVGLNQPAWKP